MHYGRMADADEQPRPPPRAVSVQPAIRPASNGSIHVSTPRPLRPSCEHARLLVYSVSSLT